MTEKTTPAALNFLYATTDLTPEDYKPLKFSDTRSRPRSKPVQRTVFHIGSEWDSAAMEAVLNAFHLSMLAVIGRNLLAEQSLKFSRASGSVEVDAEMAHIFAEPTSNSCPERAALHKNTTLPLVQCCICHRPVLFTTAVSHLKTCRTADDASGFAQDLVPPTSTAVNDNEKKSLICAPYSDSKQKAKAKDGS
ncbi:hypothetical protein FGB62_18g04 [Gracilaria domingensis]|nr:hypothetical protein FGB62_18g04 [Gracilaria domingensis]